MPQITDDTLSAFAAAHDVELFVWKIEEAEEDLQRMLPENLGYRDESTRFRSEKRRLEWLAARVLLHIVAGRSCRISYTTSGCPLLEGRDQPHISSTHRHGYVAVAVSQQAVGLDLEIFSERARLLADKFLDGDEMALVNRLGLSPEKSATILWSAKEAFFKYSSEPQVATLGDIRLCLSETKGTALEAAARVQTTVSHPQRVYFMVFGNFALTLCTEVSHLAKALSDGPDTGICSIWKFRKCQDHSHERQT